MANCKSMTVRHPILTCYERGWSKSRIARELGLHRETVARYLRLAQRADGAASPPDPKPSILPAGTSTADAGRQSQCAPLAEVIESKLDAGLTAQRVYQDLRLEHGFAGAYDAVKRFCRKLKSSDPDRVWRMECLPGEEAQVDFGSGYYLEEQPGKRRQVHFLRVVLSHSRKAYTEAVWQQVAEVFIRCLENAFRAFGGVPQTLVIDNLRAAVRKADWYEPELSPKVESFCRHYSTVILPCRVRQPEHKEKVSYCT